MKRRKEKGEPSEENEEEMIRELTEKRTAGKGKLCMICLTYPCICDLRRLEERTNHLRKKEKMEEKEKEEKRKPSMPSLQTNSEPEKEIFLVRVGIAEEGKSSEVQT